MPSGSSHRQGRFWLIWIFLLTLTIFALPACATEDTAAYQVLFLDEGREHENPEKELAEQLIQAAPATRRAMTDHLLKTIDAPGAYARAVAGRVLLRRFRLHDDELTEEAAMILGQRFGEIHRPLPDFVTDHQLEEGLIPAGLRIPVSPRFVLYIDGWPVLVTDKLPSEEAWFEPRMLRGLPEGWGASDARVVLDGVVVFEHQGLYGYEVRGKMEPFSAPREFLDPDELMRVLNRNLYGQHRLHAQLTLIAPNGVRVPIEQVSVFEVKRLDDLVSLAD